METCHQPRISVIINTCDRCETLRNTLYTLNRQTYSNFEVIAVLGPTQDGSGQMLAEEFAGQICLVHCPSFNLSVSRNLGLAAAAGEIVAFIDDDAMPCLTWLEQIAQAYDDPTVAGVGGRVYHVYPFAGELQFLFGMISVLAEQDDVRLNRDQPISSDTPVQLWFPRFMGTNMSYRREALLAMGGFDEYFEYLFEEPDLGVRCGLRGYRQEHLSEGAVYHLSANSRNRQRLTWNINWYAWMKNTIYFTLKNGPAAVGLARSIRKAIEHSLKLYAYVKGLYQHGHLSVELYRKIKWKLLRGGWSGFSHGLFWPRRIPKKIRCIHREFRPFLKADSKNYPAISPLEGRFRGVR